MGMCFIFCRHHSRNSGSRELLLGLRSAVILRAVAAGASVKVELCPLPSCSRLSLLLCLAADRWRCRFSGGPSFSEALDRLGQFNSQHACPQSPVRQQPPSPHHQHPQWDSSPHCSDCLHRGLRSSVRPVMQHPCPGKSQIQSPDQNISKGSMTNNMDCQFGILCTAHCAICQTFFSESQQGGAVPPRYAVDVFKVAPMTTDK